MTTAVKVGLLGLAVLLAACLAVGLIVLRHTDDAAHDAKYRACIQIWTDDHPGAKLDTDDAALNGMIQWAERCQDEYK
jgi:hypothetical protein